VQQITTNLVEKNVSIQRELKLLVAHEIDRIYWCVTLRHMKTVTLRELHAKNRSIGARSLTSWTYFGDDNGARLRK